MSREGKRETWENGSKCEEWDIGWTALHMVETGRRQMGV